MSTPNKKKTTKSIELSEKQALRLKENIELVSRLQTEYSSAVAQQKVLVELITDAHGIEANGTIELNENILTVQI